MELPDWVSEEHWAAFEESRRKMRIPLTDLARKRVLHKLEMFHLNGYVADEMLGEAVERSWRTVFMYPDCPRRQLSTAESANATKITQLSLSAIRSVK